MKTAHLDGVRLEYEEQGVGEPVLFISTGPIADSFRPLFCQDSLARAHRMVRYHQRGQAGSSLGEDTSFIEHARDAANLLEHLRIDRAHVAGHSTGASIALELAVERPDLVQSLALLEPPLMGVPSAHSFFEQATPALEAYQAGKSEQGVSEFLTLVSGLTWDVCRETIEEQIRGGVDQVQQDADNFFQSILPALSSWQFGRDRAEMTRCPVLSVLGARTATLFAESHRMLRSWFPESEEVVIEGVGHLLHLERPEPVAAGIAAFFARHRLTEA